MTGTPSQPVAFSRPVPGTPQRLECELGDGYRTSVYYHAPSGMPRLPVLYVHGIQSHPGWFVGSAAAMALAGYPVYQVTRRGSGDNLNARGHADSWAQLFDDVEVACRFAAAHAGARRLHLLGVSWGGKLLAAFMAHPRRTAAVASLTMVAPGLAARVDVPLLHKLAIFASLLVTPHRRYDIPLGDVRLFTENPIMQDYLRRDPLTLHDATAKFLYASRCLDWILSLCARKSPSAIAVPSSLILASRDRIIDNVRTAALAHRLTGGRCSVHELDGCHTLEFEGDPQPLHAALLSALDAQT